MSQPAGSIQVDRAARGVVTITLNRPAKKNALAPSDSGLLAQVVDVVADSPEDRVVVLTGAGDCFCAGADLTAAGTQQPDTNARLARIQDVVRALTQLPQPVVVAVNGAAVGAGLGLALCGDIVIAADTARFSAIFVKRGLGVDSGVSHLLPRLVGAGRARELALTGRFVDAAEALRIGMVTSVVPAALLSQTAGDLAQELASASATALRAIKRAMTEGAESTLSAALALETALQAECARSPEYLASRAAFAQRPR